MANPPGQPRARLISFGYLHGAPPASADPVIDLRSFRDPHINPALQQLTARDQAVVDTVLRTPGIPDRIEAVARIARHELAAGHGITVAFGCSGGRHRAPVAAEQAASILRTDGWTVDLEHRDLGKPVVHR